MTEANKAKRTKLPRWCRCRPKRVGIAVLVLGLVVVLGALLVTRSPLTRWAIIRAIEKSVPLDASCSKVRIGGDGIIRITNLRVGDPDHPAGAILEVPVCLIEVDWSTIFDDRVSVKEIALDGARVRVSVEQETGNLNLQPLFAMAGGEGDFDIPGVVLHDAQFEFGEHGAGGFELLEELVLDGQFRRLDATAGVAVSLSERTGPMHMAGEVTPDHALLEMFGVALGRFGAESMPSAIRDVMLAMDLQGQVPSVRLSYTKESGVTASADLRDVALSLPFERDGRYSPQPKDLARMTGVVGSITVSGAGLQADLTGAIEDLQYTAHLESHDVPEGDAFTLTMSTERFLLEEHPRLNPYVPIAVDQALDDFSRPTGEIDAEIEVAGLIASNGEVKSVELRSGVVHVRNMRASHVAFPYEITDVSGEIRFDARGAELVGFTGRGASGAEATAFGTIQPLNENAVLDLHASLKGVQMDEHLRKALGEERGFVLDEMFSKARLQELHDKGFTHRLDSFEMGTSLDLDVSINSGPEKALANATLRIDKAGVLLDRFPLPFYAEDVVIEASTDSVVLRSGRFTSLDGEVVELSGRADIAKLKDGSFDIDPRLDITVRDVRATPQAMYAISQAGMPQARHRPWVERVMLELGIEGRFNAEIAVLRRESGSIGYEADIRATRGTLRSWGHPGAEEMLVTHVTGKVLADEYHIDIDAKGRAGETLIESKTVVLFGQQTPRVDSLTIARNTDLSLPVEQVIGAFSRPAAKSVAGIRERRSPGGIADVQTQIYMQTIDDDPTVEVRITNAKQMQFDDPVGRITIDDSEGSATWDSRERITFDEFAADLSVDGTAQGHYAVSGLWDFVPDEPDFDLAIEASDIRIGGTLAKEALRRSLEAAAYEQVASLSLGGRTDASMELLKAGSVESVFGTLRPHLLSFRKDERRVRLEDVTGEIDINDQGLVARDIRGTVEGWQIETRGSLTRDAKGMEIKGEFYSQGPAFTDEVLGLLPEGAIETARAIKLVGAGAGSLDLTQVVALFDPKGTLSELAIDGRASLDAVSLSSAVDIKDADVSCDYAIRRDDRDQLRVSAILRAPELLVEGVSASDVYVRIQSRDGGSLWIPEFSASSHGGRFAGGAVFEGIGTNDPSNYSLTLRIGEMAFAPLLGELVDAESEDAEPQEPSDEDRGLLYAELSLTGVAGDLETQRGRGSARIFGGKVVDIPLLLQLLRVANLRLPSNEVVDLAIASFYFDGPRVVFEDLSAFAGPVEIFGFGTMTMPDQQLDLRFVPRTSSPIPIVGPLIEGISRELMTARVRGTISDRQITAEPLRRTFSFLGRVTGGQSEADELLERVERQAEGSRSRLLRMTDRARALSQGGEEELEGIEP